MPITVKELADELGLEFPDFSHGDAADFFVNFDYTLEENYGEVTNDTELSDTDAQAIRDAMAMDV